MFQDLGIFRTANAMATHAGMSQSVVTQNVANSDTPGYRAQEILSFRATFQQPKTLVQQKTRATHIESSDQNGMRSTIRYSDAEPSPNGNSVSIEEEMLKAVEISREHNLALAVYRHGLTVLRTTLGR